MRPAAAVSLPTTILCCLLMVGCTADRPRADRPAPAQSQTPTPTVSATCPASADIGLSAAGQPERQGVGDGATLWALFFAHRAVAGQEIKIAWRMTGAGDLTMDATGPDGKTTKPSWGPEAHGGSTYQRPGDEWGTGWVFPTEGCWTVNAARTTGKAHMTIRVA
jgi:hypothetical protein